MGPGLRRPDGGRSLMVSLARGSSASLPPRPSGSAEPGARSRISGLAPGSATRTWRSVCGRGPMVQALSLIHI
eukprot:844783-Alexandrium_andersonii.AAC.1